jgi:uncharacterized RDD family membrane protein YckC
MRTFSARETEWLQELDGIELAGFWRRAFALAIDGLIIGMVLSILATAVGLGTYMYLRHHGKSLTDIAHMVGAKETDGKDLNLDIELGPGPAAPPGKKVKGYRIDEDSPFGETFKVINDIVVPILYFGVLLWKGKGRTPGKRLMKIRVVSIVHRHLSFWHSVERALGYGAAALEAGFGFIQFFIHPYRRCAQDRLAETIVVTERSYQALQDRLAHPLIPDGPTAPPPSTDELPAT